MNKWKNSFNKLNSDLRDFLTGLALTAGLLILYFVMKDDPTRSSRIINRLFFLGIVGGIFTLIFGVRWIIGLVKKRKTKDEKQS